MGKRTANKEVETTDNSAVYRKAKRSIDLTCSICGPHRGTNRPPQPKHGARKPRKKDHR